MMGFELMTSSLPRMRSTPELHRQYFERGRRIELPFPAWKAGIIAIIRTPLGGKVVRPYPLLYCGQGWIRTTEGKTSRFTVCPIWPLWYLPNLSYIADREPMEGIEPTTLRLQITRSGHLSYIGSISMPLFRDCKGSNYFDICKNFCKIFSIPSLSMP